MRDVRNKIILQMSFDTQITVADVLDDWVIIGFGKEGSLAGWVHKYDRKGQLLWSINSFQDLPNDLNLGGSSGYFWVKGMIMENLNNDDTIDLLVWVGDPNWYLNRIILLSISNGQIISDYLHPGDINVKVQDMDFDEKKEVLVVGINNNLGVGYNPQAEVPVYVRVVFLFSGVNIKGMAPLTSPGTISPDIEVESSQLWYLIVTPLELKNNQLEFNSDLGYFDPIINFTKRLEDRGFQVVVKHKKGFLYYFAKDGTLSGISLADVAQKEQIPMNLYFLSHQNSDYMFKKIDRSDRFKSK